MKSRVYNLDFKQNEIYNEIESCEEKYNLFKNNPRLFQPYCNIIRKIKLKPIDFHLLTFKLINKENNTLKVIKNENIDYWLNYHLSEIHLSTIYIHSTKNIIKRLFKKYNEKVHSVLFDKIIEYLNIGNPNDFSNIYKILVNKLFKLK
tara:strand:- start:111 stop:554 length:444 start_codon:yes stop_codon:yes gene_type:complete